MLTWASISCTFLRNTLRWFSVDCILKLYFSFPISSLITSAWHNNPFTYSPMFQTSTLPKCAFQSSSIRPVEKWSWRSPKYFLLWPLTVLCRFGNCHPSSRPGILSIPITIFLSTHAKLSAISSIFQANTICRPLTNLSLRTLHYPVEMVSVLPLLFLFY